MVSVSALIQSRLLYIYRKQITDSACLSPAIQQGHMQELTLERLELKQYYSERSRCTTFAQHCVPLSR